MTAETQPLSCRQIQQRFYENLGNRDYDCFQSSEEKYLKLKIGFTLFGTPNDDEKFNNLDGDYTVSQVYNENQNQLISKLYSVIKSRSVNNEDRDQVIVSFMFNCCEFPVKKKNNTEEGNKVGCFPIFRVRKCSGSPTNKNCCVFIDEHSRVYQNWNDYLKNNKIPTAKMFVPRDGKYKGDMDDEVQLEELLSPACAVKEKVIKVADYSTTAASLVSGGIAIGSLIPAITIAPIVLTGALLTGAGVGVYSMVRSSFVLHDRNKHSQSISLANNEARNCYLNIAAGATSVVTTGATKVATIALNKGVTIGEGAATALLSVNALNITVTGCNVANSIYSIAHDIKNKKAPSAVDIMHLTTTFLFFGNAVVNFRSACTIYKDTQTRSFADMVQSRSQDLWNRARSRFFSADMTSTDNNSSVKVINDSGDYCSNALQIIVREKGTEATQNIALNLLANLLRDIDLESAAKFGFDIITNKENVYALCQIILSRFGFEIQQTMIALLKFLLEDVILAANVILKEIFPKNETIVILLNFIKNFLKFKVSEMEIEYHEKKAETIRDLGISEEEYDDNVGWKKTAERMTYFLKLTVMRMICDNGTPQEIFYREMIRYFWDWLNEQALQHTLKTSSAQNNPEIIRERKGVYCMDCGGYYYTD